MSYTQRYLNLLQQQINQQFPFHQLFELSPYQYKQLKQQKDIYDIHQRNPNLTKHRIGFLAAGKHLNIPYIEKYINTNPIEYEITRLLVDNAIVGKSSLALVHFRELTQTQYDEIQSFLADYRAKLPKLPEHLLSDPKCLSLDFIDYIDKLVHIEENLTIGEHELQIDQQPLFKLNKKGTYRVSLFLLANVKHYLYKLNHDYPIKFSYPETLLNFIRHYKATQNV